MCHISYCGSCRTGPKFFSNHSNAAEFPADGLGRGRMSGILLIVGIAMAAAGLAMLGFGAPIIEFTTGTALVMAGATIFSGGLVLIGLATVVTELGRVSEGLKAARLGAGRATPAAAAEAAPVPGPVAMAYPAAPSPPLPPPPPAPRAPAPMAAAAPAPPPPSPPVMPRRPDAAVRAEPMPTGSSAVEVSAAAIERLRSSIPRSERPRAETPAPTDEAPLSPNGPRPAHPEAPSVEAPLADDRGAADASRKSRLDFLFRSKPGRAAAQPQAEPETAWVDTRPTRTAPPIPEPRYEAPEQPAAPATPERKPEPADPRNAILKSGVVDGMAYTLYADGSIEAKLPQGTVRFASIAELRSHIEHNS